MRLKKYFIVSKQLINSLERLLDASLIAFVMSGEGLVRDFEAVNHLAMKKYGSVLKIPDILLYHTNYIQTHVLLRLIFYDRVKLYCPLWGILIICDHTIYFLIFSVYPVYPCAKLKLDILTEFLQLVGLCYFQI